MARGLTPGHGRSGQDVGAVELLAGLAAEATLVSVDVRDPEASGDDLAAALQGVTTVSQTCGASDAGSIASPI